MDSSTSVKFLSLHSDRTASDAAMVRAFATVSHPQSRNLSGRPPAGRPLGAPNCTIALKLVVFFAASASGSGLTGGLADCAFEGSRLGMNDGPGR